MKKYQSHKVVEAFQISIINGLELISDYGDMRYVTTDYLEKHEPVAGGYYVRYADGYESFSPAEPFESGYSELMADPSGIRERVASVRFHLLEGTTTTVCTLILDNGFAVTGESSAANPDSFNPKLGEQYAQDNAFENLYVFGAFLMREQAYRERAAQ